MGRTPVDAVWKARMNVNTSYVDRSQEPLDVQQSRAAPADLDYASPGTRLKPPFDYVGFIRQTVFAIGVGLLVFGETVSWGNNRAWSDDAGAWSGFGAGLIAWMIPWP